MWYGPKIMGTSTNALSFHGSEEPNRTRTDRRHVGQRAVTYAPMRYKLQIQRDTVNERVRARYAMVIPILRGMLNATATDILDRVGGRAKVDLEVFARLYLERPGDYGICFEYAVHEAIQRRDAGIHPLISDVLDTFCGIKHGAESILFGVEKNGAAKIIETAKDSLTNESRVLVGKVGKPPYLKKRLDDIAKAFHSARHRERLPQSIRGLWKADLFIGAPTSERWVATTLKIKREDLESERAPGLRLGLYPEERRGQGPKLDESGMIMCPLPYAGDFMQLFGASFAIVKQVIASGGKLPSRAALYYDDDMTVAQWLVDRRELPVVEVLAALEPLAQPGLVQESDAVDEARVLTADRHTIDTEAAAPIARILK